MKRALLIFVKNLIVGRVKTRLAATIGNTAALSVYRQLLIYTEKTVRDLSANKIVFYSVHPEGNDIWDINLYNKQAQTGIDLGERMQNAFSYAFEEGNNAIAIIGSDCLELSAEIIENAFSNLRHYDVVIGPAKDGGYYLLAIKQNHKELFRDIQWSTGEVLQKTIEACDKLKLRTYLLPELSDIDDEDDLKKTGTHITYIKNVYD